MYHVKHYHKACKTLLNSRKKLSFLYLLQGGIGKDPHARLFGSDSVIRSTQYPPCLISNCVVIFHEVAFQFIQQWYFFS